MRFCCAGEVPWPQAFCVAGNCCTAFARTAEGGSNDRAGEPFCVTFTLPCGVCAQVREAVTLMAREGLVLIDDQPGGQGRAGVHAGGQGRFNAHAGAAPLVASDRPC